ncbi:MAG: hypothetical protein Kow0029_10570 [Candidatus Rifleibacteriota bacterium]
MREIFDKLEFRPFSYEEDPEAVVDMHRCAENLEGSWFDAENTCKLHSKLIIKSPGSSWLVKYGNMVFGHADLVKCPTGEAVVIALRIHTDYHYPQVVRKMVEGLKEQARKRECSGIIIFGDNSEVISDIAMIGLSPDREYSYARPIECETGLVLEYKQIDIHPDDVVRHDLYPFLGTPLPAQYLSYRATMAAEQGLFHYRRPLYYEIKFGINTYIASFDGREWHIFRKGNFKGDREAIASLLKTIATINPSRILLSAAAMEAAELIPASDGVLYDYFISL